MANPLYELPDPHTLKLEVGKLIWNRFIDNALEFPPGGVQAAATGWLTAIGFERVEWYQHGDLELQCQLWYTDENGTNHNFMLESCGADGSDITLWDISGEVQM